MASLPIWIFEQVILVGHGIENGTVRLIGWNYSGRIK